jgi:ribose transport system substrate-binding protein
MPLIAHAGRAARRLAFAAGVSLILGLNAAPARELKSIGVSIANLNYPFFASIAKGAEFEARKTNPNVKITTVEHYWDPGTQSAQIDAFIAAGVDLIVLNTGDPTAIEPAIDRAHEAGIPVVATDSRTAGADVTVETNNVQAGTIACEYLVEKMGGKGAMLILSFIATRTSAIDRAKGCSDVVAKHPDVKILPQDEDTLGTRDGGFTVGVALLGRFPQVDGVFALNDFGALGMAAAAKKLNRVNFPITAVDGTPEAVRALKDPNTPQFAGTASQDPFMMGRMAVQAGVKILDGQKPDHDVVQMDSKMVTRDNVNEYKGWTSN